MQAGAENAFFLSAKRQVIALGNALNTNYNPLCFNLKFRTRDSVVGNYSITIADDPTASYPLLAADLDRNIPHTFDSSATANIGPPPPTPFPGQVEIQARVVSGDPCAPNSAFTLAVEAASNSTGSAPMECAFAVTYSSAHVSFVSASAGDLGDVFLGAETSNLFNLTRRIGTLGEYGNADQTPVCFFLTFATRPTILGPVSIGIANDPNSSAPLLAPDLAAICPTCSTWPP